MFMEELNNYKFLPKKDIISAKKFFCFSNVNIQNQYKKNKLVQYISRKLEGIPKK